MDFRGFWWGSWDYKRFYGFKGILGIFRDLNKFLGVLKHFKGPWGIMRDFKDMKRLKGILRDLKGF